MNRPVIKDTSEFLKLCGPVFNYLKENCDPYVEVHISVDRIRVTSVECSIPLKNGEEV